jgi:hypothetical protein
MTHHMSCEVAVLAGIVSLYLSVFALPVSPGMAGQRTDSPVSSLIEMLRNGDNHVRQAAAEALGQMGSEAKSAIRPSPTPYSRIRLLKSGGLPPGRWGR